MVELLLPVEVLQIDPGVLSVLGTKAFLDFLQAEGLIEIHLAKHGVAL